MLEYYSVCCIARSRLAVDNGWKDLDRGRIRDPRQAEAGYAVLSSSLTRPVTTPRPSSAPQRDFKFEISNRKRIIV